MPSDLLVLLAQINPLVGAIETNASHMIAIIQEHQKTHDLILFPELALTGYPPEDLLSRNDFYPAVEKAMRRIQEQVQDCHVIIGHPHREGALFHNTASVFYQQQCKLLYHKQHLPNQGVFDEKRYFAPGSPEPILLEINDYRMGLCICEDLWQPGPVEILQQAGASILLCLNASPFDYTKYQQREALLKNHAQKGIAILYVNQTGGQDELVFDGLSLAINSLGEVVARAPAFQESFLSVTVTNDTMHGAITELPDTQSLIYEALLCGIRDYVQKNGFPGVLLGLSGGIDSALTLALAVDALGADKVEAVLMPSRYSAEISMEDAISQAQTMGVHYTILPIENAFVTLLETLSPVFHNLPCDITEENLQARIRGLLLMALSNKQGKMVLCTSNKSETAVGYSTLYGDMVGGLCPLQDVLKTRVYDLANYRNKLSPVIPERVITRAPSAELAPNQKDADSLPDYGLLDAIIQGYVEKDLSPEELVALGYDAEVVQKTIKMIVRNEYKRYQAPPGIKITPRAFGRDWRYPITRGFW